jgi:hypothetical protein
MGPTALLPPTEGVLRIFIALSRVWTCEPWV